MNLAGIAERSAGRLVRGRAAALALMTSQVVVMRRVEGDSDQDEDSGLETQEWAVVDLDVPFRLDGSSTGDGGTRSVTIDSVTYQQATGIGHLPHDQQLADDDLLLITAGEWVGSVYRVIEAVKRDRATARRVPVVEESPPTEWAA